MEKQIDNIITTTDLKLRFYYVGLATLIDCLVLIFFLVTYSFMSFWDCGEKGVAESTLKYDSLNLTMLALQLIKHKYVT